jgi:hypothetical protein
MRIIPPLNVANCRPCTITSLQSRSLTAGGSVTYDESSSFENTINCTQFSNKYFSICSSFVEVGWVTDLRSFHHRSLQNLRNLNSLLLKSLNIHNCRHPYLDGWSPGVKEVFHDTSRWQTLHWLCSKAQRQRQFFTNINRRLSLTRTSPLWLTITRSGTTWRASTQNRYSSPQSTSRVGGQPATKLVFCAECRFKVTGTDYIGHWSLPATHHYFCHPAVHCAGRQVNGKMALGMSKFCMHISEVDSFVGQVVSLNESLTAEREQVRKIRNMSFLHLGILLTAEREQVFCNRIIPRWRKLILRIFRTCSLSAVSDSNETAAHCRHFFRAFLECVFVSSGTPVICETAS